MDEKVPNQSIDAHSAEYHVEEATAGAKYEEETTAHNVAIKGDDSDGKLDWTARSFMAYISLCLVYTGMSIHAHYLLNVCSIS